jgi:putative transposase
VTDTAIAELAPTIGVRDACQAVGAAQAGYYRRHRQSPPPQRPAPVPHRERVQPRALSRAERKAILEALHSDRFVDLAPAEVWATLLDEGVYLGSISTFYRLLRQAGETRERRRQATHPATVKPELVATAANQVWSWDITKLRGPAKWTYYYLYVILDIFSRYVVGWMVASRESAALAQVLIRQTVAKQGIGAAQLTIHADRGSSMTSKPVAFLLAEEQSSRPVDEDLLGGFGLMGFVGSFDELAVDEHRAGADEGDEMRCVDRAPAVLRGLDELERHREPSRA